MGKGGTVGSLNPSSAIVNNGIFGLYRSSNITQGTDFGTISGSGAIVKNGGGIAVLNAANSYTGVTTIQAGTLSVDSVANAGANSPLGAYATAGAAGISMTGGTLRYTGATASTDRGFTLGGNATIDVTPTSGTSTLTLGASSIGDTRTLTVSGGTGSGLALSGLTFTGASGGLTVNSPVTLTLPSTITTPTNFALTLSGSGTSTYSANLSTGTSTLTKSGGGTWTLGGTTTAANLTVNGGGTLTVGSAKTISVGGGASNSINIAVNGQNGHLNASAATSFTANVGTLRVGYGSNDNSSGSLALAAENVITAATDFSVGANGTNEHGVITTPVASTTQINTPLMQLGAGRLTSGSFTLAADATLDLAGISGGRTQLVIGQVHQGTNQANWNNNGTMNLSAGVASLKLSSLVVGQATVSANTNYSTGTLTFGTSGDNLLDISGTGSVVRIGDSVGQRTTGTVTIGNLDPASAITTTTEDATAILIGTRTGGSGVVAGTLNVNGGTLTITTAGTAGRAIGSGGGGTSTLNLSGGAKLIAGAGSTDWISGLTTATIGEGGATIDTAGNDISISQEFSGAGGLTKQGAGLLTLSAANNFTGDTVVEAGTLVLTDTGVLAGALTIASTGTLGGTGTIDGGLHFEAGGKLLFNSDTFENAAAALAVGPVFFGSYDVTFDGFSVASLVGLDETFAEGTYTLITGSIDFTNVSNFGVSNAVSIGDGKSAYFKEGSLQLVIIPEPGTLSMIGVIGIAMLLRRRIVKA